MEEVPVKSTRNRSTWEIASAAKLNDSRNARKLVEALTSEPDALENLVRKLREAGHVPADAARR